MRRATIDFNSRYIDNKDVFDKCIELLNRQLGNRPLSSDETEVFSNKLKSVSRENKPYRYLLSVSDTQLEVFGLVRVSEETIT